MNEAIFRVLEYRFIPFGSSSRILVNYVWLYKIILHETNTNVHNAVEYNVRNNWQVYTSARNIIIAYVITANLLG